MLNTRVNTSLSTSGVGNLRLCEALTGGAFDNVNCQHSGKFDQIFSKHSKAQGLRGGVGEGGVGWARLDLI